MPTAGFFFPRITSLILFFSIFFPARSLVCIALVGAIVFTVHHTPQTSMLQAGFELERLQTLILGY
jgi:hypothetical protein